MSVYRFVKHEQMPFEKLANDCKWILHEKLIAEDTLTREEKNELVFSDYAPTYKRGGWAIDFREFLNEYWVETKWYGINKWYAWDKTAIRERLRDNGDPVIKIVEVE